ncbi:MAG: transcription antitermination factor NusB [Bdellovibrionales bacterium GWA2_49_15]|nr:MAG: transcription antitermination factor NusB [Bdellovibrionales bacterium GWA2_49_15]HAZ12100.1 transcription antitermination factor NusB [Bdellovibrionales bacterium]
MSSTYNAKQAGREFAFRFLYQWEVTNTDSSSPPQDEALDTAVEFFRHMFIDENEKALTIDQRGLTFARQLISKVFSNNLEIEECLTKFLKFKGANSANKVDMALLKLGTCELLFFADTPYKVVINEAINLAKQYGPQDSPSFINGVLDKVAHLKQ